MNLETTDIKEGIRLHKIKTNKYKTNLMSVFLTSKLSRDDITKKALILTVLRRGTNNLKTQEEISKKLEELYGASFDCGIDKLGDKHVLKFYVESLNEQYLYQKEDILSQSLNILFDIVFNPLLENGVFKQEYIDEEKQNLRIIIEGQKDNKAAYATQRCIEEMYKEKPYGLYKYGYVEDLEKIDSKNLYETYLNLIKTCKIDIFVSGDFDEKTLEEKVKSNQQISKLEPRKVEYLDEESESSNTQEENVVRENMQISQGKLNIGLDVLSDNKSAVSVYNAILGGGANSKLFQNVREKASLAYSAGSIYIKPKSKIIIKTGIEHKNYEKALQIIKEQIDNMKNGEFSDEDIQHAKELIIASFKAMQDEQDSEISFYFGREIQKESKDIDKQIKEVSEVTKQNIVDVANKIKINTIFFLTRE